MENFQSRVNETCGSDHLQFTAEIWNCDAPENIVPSNENVKINRKKAFPYLDVEMYWLDDDLKFRVHLKENQLLKYLNKGSAHTRACFKAIPNGVTRRLASLTSMTPENADTRLDILYPDHASALTRAGLILNEEFPTL